MSLRRIKPVYYFLGPPASIFFMVVIYALQNLFLPDNSKILPVANFIVGFLGIISSISLFICIPLGIYFVITKNKKPKSKEHEQVDGSLPLKPQIQVSFPRLVREFFLDYPAFLKNYLTCLQPPFLMWVIWIAGMASAIDKMELRALRGQGYLADNWSKAWIYIAIGGLLAGIITWFVWGSFYHLRIWLSGGSGEVRQSRNIYLYANLPLFGVIILSTLFDAFFYGNAYFQGETNAIEGSIWFFIITVAYIYSLILSYRAARILCNTKKLRSIIFFIVLPLLFYISAIIFVWYFLPSGEERSFPIFGAPYIG